MPRHTRRTFLCVSGGLLGGIAAGSTVTAVRSGDRYIVDATGVDNYRGVEVVHELDQVDLAVVRGREEKVKKLSGQYVTDVEYYLDRPRDGTLEHRYESDGGGGGSGGDDGPGNGKGKGRGNGGGSSGSTQEDSATDESLYPLQWDKQVLDIPAVHDVTRGEGTRVAIIDSGVAAGHPDLQHAVNVDLSRNFTEDDYGAGGPFGSYHGTHVAGIVAASDTNEAGVVGTAPGTEVVDCRVFSPGELAAFGDILAAIVYSAFIGCDAANLSLGAYPVPREGLGGFYGKALNRTMTYANSEGTLLSIAAGNDSADLQHDGNVISIPNEGARAVSVSATGPIGFQWDADGDGEVADLAAPPESPAFYTNYGTNAIDLGAPGGDAALEAIGTGVNWHYDLVLSTLAEPTFADDGTYQGAAYGYGWAAGTSMAAPQVTGAAAILRSQDPGSTTGDVESSLKEAAEVPDGYDRTFYGGGFLNILDAL